MLNLYTQTQALILIVELMNEQLVCNFLTHYTRINQYMQNLTFS